MKPVGIVCLNQLNKFASQKSILCRRISIECSNILALAIVMEAFGVVVPGVVAAVPHSYT